MVHKNQGCGKQLTEIDKVYGRLHTYATIPERIKYCSSLIQKTESYVNRHHSTITEHIITRSAEMIEAARQELNFLSQKKQSH
jgi:hypothetical protein